MKWDYFLLHLANEISKKSKDPSTKIGALIVDENKRPVSWGYNGLPQGVLDTDKRYDDRNIKLKIILHAEHNAILFAKRDLKNCSLYTTAPPCAHCSSIIIQSGIKEIYCFEPEKEFQKRWQNDIRLSEELFFEAEVNTNYINKKIFEEYMKNPY